MTQKENTEESLEIESSRHIGEEVGVANHIADHNDDHIQGITKYFGYFNCSF